MKNLIKFILLSASILVLIIFINSNSWHLIESPVSAAITLNEPSFVTGDSGSFYTIDNSRRRIMKFSVDGMLEFVINGGSRSEGRFFYANDLTVDGEGNLFVFNEIPDSGGFYVVREEILKYDAHGKFTGVLHYRNHEKKTSTLIQRGRFKKLKYKNSMITWFEINSDRISFYKISPSLTLNMQSSDGIDEKYFSYPEADIFISYITELDGENWVAVNKKGIIEKLNLPEGRIENIYQTAGTGIDSLSVPWNLDAYAGKIYFTDIGDNTIKQIDIDSRPVFSDETLVSNGIESEGETYYTLEASENFITTCNSTYAIRFNPSNGEIKCISEITLSPYFIMMKILTFASIILSAVLVIYLISFVYRNIFKSNLPAIIFNIILITVIISITTLLISTVLFKNFSSRYVHTVTDKTSQMAQLFAQNADGELFKKITRQSDFMNEDYRKIRNSMHRSLNDNSDSWNDRYYFVLYRVYNDSLYGLMYLNDEITPFHYFDYFDDTEGAYRQAYEGRITAETDSDTWGTWIYSVGPVRDSKGNVIALIEVGTDLYSYNVENNRLFRELFIEVLTLILVLLFIIIEIIFFNDLILKKNSPDREQSGYVETFILRPINFLFTLGISMSVAFVPLMMRSQFIKNSIYMPLLGLSDEMVIAVPISLEMLFFVSGILIAGEIAHRGKWKIILTAGTFISAFGLLLSGLSTGMYMFFAARSVTGLGSGLVLIGLRTVISSEKNPEMKSQAYSHFYSGAMAGLNVGVFFGAFLADQIGFHSVFYIAFFIVIISMIFMKIFLNKIRYTSRADRKTGISIIKFMTSPKIFFYFLMIILPTYTAGMFLVYYFPLFADSKGISVADIGKFFILNGIFIIYLGPVLSKYIIKYAGAKKAAIFGSFGWAASLAVFALTGNMYGAMATIIMMSLTEGFCVTAQNDYYLGMDIVKRTGDEKSIAYFEVAAKFSEILAPLIFGSLLFFGDAKGIMYIASGIVFLTVLYIVFTGRRSIRSERNTGR